jgi:hypothetical protein
MIRAVVRDGTIQPLEPMPPDWRDGREVVVTEAEPSERRAEIDQWFRELEASAAELDPEDDQRLTEAVVQIRQQAKETARREMGRS